MAKQLSTVPTRKRRPVRVLRRRLRTTLRTWRRRRALKKKRQQRGIVYFFAITLLLLFGSFGWSLSYLGVKQPGAPLKLNELDSLIKQKRVVEATFQDEDAQLVGTYRALAKDTKLPPKFVPTGPAAAASGTFTVSYQKSDAVSGLLTQQLVDSGAKVAVDKQQDKSRVRLITTFLLPLMILANLFMLLFSLSRGSGSSAIGEVMTFGSIGAKKHKRGQSKAVTFADVAGANEAVAELREVRDYLADPERYEELGAQPPKGVLLFGPPGCGKTLLAKAVAGEAGVPFFSVAGAEFVESLVGVGAARVRDLFARVRAVAPAIVFIDELDAAGRKRGTGSGGSDEREQTLNQLLVEMDGFDVSSGIVVMAATNRPDIIDPALMRPGRFDRHITVDQPDHAGRLEILALHARGRPVSATVDFDYLARRTPGFTGADLANVVNEAALLAVREGNSEIHTPQLEEAIQRVLNGPQRRGRVLSPEERKRTAYHESGHAVVAAAVGRFEHVHRVSILSRGRAAGTTGLHLEGDVALLTKSQLHARLVTTMAGLAAEEMVFGEPSTGSENDLEQATEMARDMIARYGMGAKTGRMRLAGKASDGFLGDEVPLGQVSGQSLQDLDTQVRELLGTAEAEATRLLVLHRTTLDHLSGRLEVDETLEGPELEAALSLVRPEIAVLAAPTQRRTSSRNNSRRVEEVTL